MLAVVMCVFYSHCTIFWFVLYTREIRALSLELRERIFTGSDITVREPPARQHTTYTEFQE